ncbi:hypothetical protein ACEQPO_17115 [Bacillus sp. SL00103]
MYIAIQFPDHFVEGDIALEVKSPVFTLIRARNNQNGYSFLVFELYKTILMPAKNR